MILVDTSVWIQHLRHPDRVLSEYLETPELLMHELVIGELVCGNHSDRANRLAMWRGMPRIEYHSHEAVIDWIESEHLMGLGIGFIDAHLLYSTVRRPETRLWTQDKRLERLARRFGVAHPQSN